MMNMFVGKPDDDFSYVPLTNMDEDSEVNENSESQTFISRKARSTSIWKLMVCTLLMIAVITVVLLAIITPKNRNENQESEAVDPSNINTQSHVVNGSEWEKTFTGYGTESIIRLVDIDGDGIQEVIIGAFFHPDMSTLEKLCEHRNASYPCLGRIFALRGSDGKVLWETRTRSNPVLFNCVDFDINLDGIMDCIVTGRLDTIQAINSKNGETFWLGESTFLEKLCNIYQVMALPDFNHDGVAEMVLVSGGKPYTSDNDFNRTSGRMILFDGRTGTNMGRRYLSMPNSRESYQSPVSYVCKDGSQYILFGSGGETIPGDFMMISVPDFYRYVMELDHAASVPNVLGSYNQWPHIARANDTGIMVIYRGERRGVMVPQLIVDINHDGVEDILLSVFEGTVILIDGHTMEHIWRRDFPNMQSYCSLAPGYFNEDDTLDFMCHWSAGLWGRYTNTKKIIIDGKDGSVMWELNSTMFQESSDLSLKTHQPYRDIFVFRTSGRDSQFHFNSQMRSVRPSSPRKIAKRHGGGEDEEEDFPQNNHNISHLRHLIENKYRSVHFLCEEDVDIKSEIFLMDRSISHNPIQVLEIKPQRYYYSSTGILTPPWHLIPPLGFQKSVFVHFLQYSYLYPEHPKDLYFDITDDDSYGDKNKTYCIVLLPDLLQSAFFSVGDVDGDGSLDLIAIKSFSGNFLYQSGLYYNMAVQKINLEPFLKKQRTHAHVKTRLPVTKYTDTNDISHQRLLSLKDQHWTSYLGTRGNSHLKEQIFRN